MFPQFLRSLQQALRAPPGRHEILEGAQRVFPFLRRVRCRQVAHLSFAVGGRRGSPWCLGGGQSSLGGEYFDLFRFSYFILRAIAFSSEERRMSLDTPSLRTRW